MSNIGRTIIASAKKGEVVAEETKRGKLFLTCKMTDGSTKKLLASFVEFEDVEIFAPADWSGPFLTSAEVVRNKINR